MNAFLKYLTFFPTLRIYLKGGVLFHDGKYKAALQKFEKCLKHPEFQNEQVFSFYGQTLCGLGRLNDGYEYLLKACKIYEQEGWQFESEFTQNLARNTLNALEHVFEHTSLNEGIEYLDNELKLKVK